MVECLRSTGCEVGPLGRHCIVSLSKTLYPLLSTGSAHLNNTEKMLTAT